jgi:hypothetical protein
LAEWEYYFSLEPFGSFRDDHNLAHIAQLIHNVAVRKEDQKPLKDFLLKFDQEEIDEPVAAKKSNVVEFKQKEDGAAILRQHQTFLNLLAVTNF